MEGSPEEGSGGGSDCCLVYRNLAHLDLENLQGAYAVFS